MNLGLIKPDVLHTHVFVRHGLLNSVHSRLNYIRDWLTADALVFAFDSAITGEIAKSQGRDLIGRDASSCLERETRLGKWDNRSENGRMHREVDAGNLLREEKQNSWRSGPRKEKKKADYHTLAFA